MPKIARKVKVGDVIQFPRTQFAPLRRGWNGWLFSAGIIEKLYISKSGQKCARVRYCTRRAGRYQLLPNTETTINLKREHLFEYDLEWNAKQIREFLEAEKAGEQICWSEDAALLVNHGLI
jgi:hypothetical protein